MKVLCYLALLAIPAIAFAQTTPQPPPAKPISAPQPGMKWVVTIENAPQLSEGRRAVTASGEMGPKFRKDTLTYDSGNPSAWYTVGHGILLEQDTPKRVVVIPVEDDSFDAATRFRVSTFPGVGWVTPDKLASQKIDEKSLKPVAIYEQKIAPYKTIGEGEESLAIPTGATVAVLAEFDATTGLPLRAKVGDAIYTYAIEASGATDPVLPAAVRQEMERVIARSDAVSKALQRQQERRNKQ